MEKLNILWTTDNKETIYNMLFMYAANSKIRGWWSEVNVIIWGASARLAGADVQIQAEIKDLLRQGVTVEACQACADNFGVSEQLSALGVTVRYMGQPLTDYLKRGEKILTL